MNIYQKITTTCGLVIMTGMLATTPASARKLYVQTEHGSVSGHSSQAECEYLGTSCGQFDDDCAGYQVWMGNDALDMADKAYYNGEKVTIYPFDNVSGDSWLCYYKQ